MSLRMLSSALVAAALVCNTKSFSWKDTTALLAFGDSYTYVQGTYGHSNYSFIGDAFAYSFTPAQLFSDRIVQNQTGTSAGGPNWVEYLTGCYEGLPSRCVRLGQKQLWDFAFAGADASASLLPLHHNYSIDLDDQVAQWDEFARPYLRLDRERTLVAFWIGINDVSDSARNASVASFPALYDAVTGRLFESAHRVSAAGYQNFLFMGLPPLERTPPNVLAAQQGQPLAPNASQVAEYDAALREGAERFGREDGVNVMVFDTHGFLNGVIDDAAQYGIKNTTGYCPDYDAPDIATNYSSYGCLPIKEYFWYNTGHITYHVHSILAQGLDEYLDAQSSW